MAAACGAGGAATVTGGRRRLRLAADVAPALRILLCVGALLGTYLPLLVVVLPTLVADVRATVAKRSASPATT